ncbi:MAG: hypothetical protein MJK04_10540, partial [Psychrosphaera sp.]|nr:hypothetical protein [Psychrosphaera sp.]
ELDKLLEWSTADKFPITLRLLTGEGGTGKTRLATQLCHELAKQNWTVGFLQRNQQKKELAATWQGLKASGKPCLVVVDYAETQSDELINLLKLILDSSEHKNVCLLLLARDGGDWWDNLPTKDPATDDLLFGSATFGPYLVPPLYQEQAQREQGYLNALNAFSTRLNLDETTVIPDLSCEHFAKPLYIQMAALLALHGEQPTSADGITKAILTHEQRYWAEALNSEDIDVSPQTAKKLLALVTLAGNFATAKEAQSYWAAADENILSVEQFRRLFDCLSPLYPASQGLQAVKPDLLGEALLGELLTKPSGPALLSAVLDKSSSNEIKLHALTVLARLSLYKPALDAVVIDAFAEHLTVLVPLIVAASLESNSRLPALTVFAMGKLNNNELNSVAAQLASLIEDDSIALNVLACEAYRIIYGKTKKKFEKKSKVMKVRAEYASALFDYSLSLYLMGRSSEACVLVKLSVEIRYELTKLDAARYDDSYTKSLANYASFLAEVGQIEPALKIEEELLVIRQHLAKKNPARYEAGHAATLGNYSTNLYNSLALFLLQELKCHHSL